MVARLPTARLEDAMGPCAAHSLRLGTKGFRSGAHPRALINLPKCTAWRIWAMHKLQPHRLRTFKRSRDPDFEAKLTDIVGLYMNPPAHAIVLSLDEKPSVRPGRP